MVKNCWLMWKVKIRLSEVTWSEWQQDYFLSCGSHQKWLKAQEGWWVAFELDIVKFHFELLYFLFCMKVKLNIWVMWHWDWTLAEIRGEMGCEDDEGHTSRGGGGRGRDETLNVTDFWLKQCFQISPENSQIILDCKNTKTQQMTSAHGSSSALFWSFMTESSRMSRWASGHVRTHRSRSGVRPCLPVSNSCGGSVAPPGSLSPPRTAGHGRPGATPPERARRPGCPALHPPVLLLLLLLRR